MRLPLSFLLTPLTKRNLLMTRLTLTAAVLMTTAVSTFAIPFVHPTRRAGPAGAFQVNGQQEPDSEANKAMLRRRHELDLLQGTWYRISSEMNGHKVFVESKWPIPATTHKFAIVFKDDGWYGVGKDGKTLVKNHVIKLDPTRRPKEIDLYYLDRKGNPRNGALIHGIYELEGDILKLCLSIGGGPNDRPKEFATRAGPRQPVLDVYRWVRTVDAKPDLDDSNNPPKPSQEHKEMH